MPPIVTAPLAVEARDALTVAQGRVQLLRRRIDRGKLDCARFLTDLDDVCLRIRRAVTMVDAIEDELKARARLTALTPIHSRNVRPR